MALKPNRSIESTDITYYVVGITGTNSTRMERGGVVCPATGTPGSGAAMDTSAQAVEYLGTASGSQAIGILMNDFVNIDQSRQQLNQYKDEAQVGTKAVIAKRGWIVTNMLAPSVLPSGSSIAYAGNSGMLTTISGAGLPIVGRFMSRVDAEGFCKVEINIP